MVPDGLALLVEDRAQNAEERGKVVLVSNAKAVELRAVGLLVGNEDTRRSRNVASLTTAKSMLLTRAAGSGRRCGNADGLAGKRRNGRSCRRRRLGGLRSLLLSGASREKEKKACPGG